MYTCHVPKHKVLCNGSVFLCGCCFCCNVDLFANDVAAGSLLTFSLELFGSIVLNNLVSSAISQA